MPKQLFAFLALFFPYVLFGQNAEVEAGLKVDSLDVSSGLIKNVADPISAQDAATKNYVDALEEVVRELQFQLITLEQCGTTSVVDYDGNSYRIIAIGDQCWLAENLRNTTYNDGTSIQLISDNSWGTTTKPAYCWYNSDEDSLGHIYGALYNYFTIADTNSRNVCPVGWHVPSDSEWTTLADELDPSAVDPNQVIVQSYVAGGKLKKVGNINWNLPNLGATNESNFTGLPAGIRSTNGAFTALGDIGYFWTRSLQEEYAWMRYLHYNDEGIFRDFPAKNAGLSVRCIKD